MKEFIKGMYQKQNFSKRLVVVLLAVIIMGFSLSWLVRVDLGIDPYTSMNLAISDKLGISLGNWQALLNSIMFLLVIAFGREHIGFGTLANMFLVGYALDFFTWLWDMFLPADAFESMTVRILVLIPALAVFVVSAAVYMDVELGTAPYDAIPIMISKYQKKVPFSIVRMLFDSSVILLGLGFDAKIGIVTILMAFTLGPVIAWIGARINSFLGIEYE